MEDFYDSIRDNLENRPEPSFKEDAWKAMEGKLSEYERSQARVVVWPWWSYAMLALLPLSMLLNAWLIWQRPDGSTTSFDSVETYVQVDTVLKTQLIYQRDTVVQTRIIRQLVDSGPSRAQQPWNPEMANALLGLSRRWDAGQVNRELLSNSTLNPNGIQPTLANNLMLLRESLGPEAGSKEETELATLGAELLPVQLNPVIAQLPTLEDEPMQGLPISGFSYTPPPIWEHLRPQGASVGTQMGILLPTSKGMIDPHAFQRGFQLKLQLPNQLAIWSEFALIDIKYRLEETGDRVDIADVDPPAPNFEFQNIQVWQERTHLAVGLEYAFSTRRRRAPKPLVAIGYNALGFKPYEIFYEFLDSDTGTEIQVEESIDRTDGPMHYLATKASYQWPLGRRGVWDLSLNYRRSLNDNRFTNPNMVGLTSSFAWQF
ncbi:MAG: hypothetical protein F6K19_12900 [Cyanothece sp. SIO1E1]|nr:hypothetical protein [Cyanothece sp. SIO1E1]